MLEWLKAEGEEIVGLVVHPAEKGKYREEILSASKLDDARIFEGPALRDTQSVETILGLNADIGVSAYFGYLIGPEMLKALPKGCVNVHPSMLPFNRGAYPNVWTIVDRTPAGATIHFVEEGVDTGDIIAQMEVSVEPTDTGQSLYRKLERASLELFKSTWPLIATGTNTRIPQSEGEGTHHRVKDVERIDEIDLDGTYKAGDLIDLLRARTFPPYKGAYFTVDGRRVYLRLELEYGDETGGD